MQFKEVPGRSAGNRSWDVWPVGRSEGWPMLASWPRWPGPRGEGERRGGNEEVVRKWDRQDLRTDDGT